MFIISPSVFSVSVPFERILESIVIYCGAVIVRFCFEEIFELAILCRALSVRFRFLFAKIVEFVRFIVFVIRLRSFKVSNLPFELFICVVFRFRFWLLFISPELFVSVWLIFVI